jgi:hypothetical protein
MRPGFYTFAGFFRGIFPFFAGLTKPGNRTIFIGSFEKQGYDWLFFQPWRTSEPVSSRFGSFFGFDGSNIPNFL